MVKLTAFIFPMSLATTLALATAAYDTDNNKKADDADAAESRYFAPNVNYATIYQGTWQPNNIAIHVTQNLVNFVASTLFWFFASFFYSETIVSAKTFSDVSSQFAGFTGESNGFNKRSAPEEQQPESSESLGIAKYLSGRRMANVLRSVADAAEGFDR